MFVSEDVHNNFNEAKKSLPPNCHGLFLPIAGSIDAYIVYLYHIYYKGFHNNEVFRCHIVKNAQSIQSVCQYS